MFEMVYRLLPPGQARTNFVLTATAICGGMSTPDAFIHLPYGVSDPLRRHQSYQTFGPTITNHIGNTIISELAMIPYIVEEYNLKRIGEERNNQNILDLARYMPLFGLATVVIINLVSGVIHNEPNPQGSWRYCRRDYRCGDPHFCHSPRLTTHGRKC
jgi:hypothetical protein